MDREVSADVAFSLRDQFPDQWYELLNPAQSASPMKVHFRTDRHDFPPNVEDLRLRHVLLYLVPGDEQQPASPVTGMLFTSTVPPNGTTEGVGGTATPIAGVVSTRRGNGSPWLAMIDAPRAPYGQWELALPNDQVTQDLFTNGQIEDILLVVTYSGLTPAWTE